MRLCTSDGTPVTVLEEPPSRTGAGELRERVRCSAQPGHRRCSVRVAPVAAAMMLLCGGD